MISGELYAQWSKDSNIVLDVLESQWDITKNVVFQFLQYRDDVKNQQTVKKIIFGGFIYFFTNFWFASVWLGLSAMFCVHFWFVPAPPHHVIRKYDETPCSCWEFFIEDTILDFEVSFFSILTFGPYTEIVNYMNLFWTRTTLSLLLPSNFSKKFVG